MSGRLVAKPWSYEIIWAQNPVYVENPATFLMEPCTLEGCPAVMHRR